MFRYIEVRVSGEREREGERGGYRVRKWEDVITF